MGIGRSGPDYSQITVKGIIGSFYDSLDQEYAGSWASTIGVTIDSNQSIETYRWLGLPPAMRLWLGARQAKGLPIKSFTIENQNYESTLACDRDELKFDKTGQLMIRLGEHAAKAAQHWENLTSALIETNGTCYDGQAFFATAHTMGGENASTYKNTLTSTEVAALNVTTAAAPTPDEMAQALIGCVSYIYTFKDNESEPYNAGARQFVVMVSPNLMGSTMAALRAILLGPGTSGGGNSNQLLVQDFSLKLIVNPRLTSTDVFYIFRTDGRMKPFILQNAVSPQVEFLGEGSDRAFLTNQYLFGVRAVRAAGYGQWAHALKCTLS